MKGTCFLCSVKPLAYQRPILVQHATYPFPSSLTQTTDLELGPGSKDHTMTAHAFLHFMLIHKWGECPDAEEFTACVDAPVETGPCGSPPPRTSRKRKKPSSGQPDPIRLQRLAESIERDDLFAPHFREAYTSFRASLASHAEDSMTRLEHQRQSPDRDIAVRGKLARSSWYQQIQKPLDLSRQGICELSADAAHAEPKEPWDLLALAHLKAVVKPKFSFHDEEHSCDLFDRLISNVDTEDRGAWAHERNVQVPAASSFLLADMSKFNLLVPGESPNIWENNFWPQSNRESLIHTGDLQDYSLLVDAAWIFLGEQLFLRRAIEMLSFILQACFNAASVFPSRQVS